jgi:transcriptional regulator with XRE-family HTH domain
MTGDELVAWRKRNGLTQEDLMAELDVKSRQTISSWESADRKVPRLVELAVRALDLEPSQRRRAGKRATSAQARDYFAGEHT